MTCSSGWKYSASCDVTGLNIQCIAILSHDVRALKKPQQLCSFVDSNNAEDLKSG